MPLPSATGARLLMVAAALLFSTGGAAVKATALSGWQTAGLRSLVAGVALLLLVPAARQGWSLRILPPAVSYALTLVLFVHSTKLTTAANAIFLQSTAPAYLLLLGPLVLKERIRPRDLLFTLALAGGMALFFAGEQRSTATAPEPWKGNLLAALSGLAWALTLAALRWLAHARKTSGSLATVTLGNFLAFLACAGMTFPVSGTPQDWLTIAYLGVVQIGLGYVCLTRAVRAVPAFEASILLMVEPVMNPLWAWLIHRETPTAWAAAGCAVILASTLAKLWIDRRADL